jgi:hypothetical protein
VSGGDELGGRVMATRRVSKADARTAEDVFAWIASETGGMVVCVSEPVDRGDHWEFEAWSSDGRAATPLLQVKWTEPQAESH